MNSNQAKRLALLKVCRWHAKTVLDNQDILWWYNLTDMTAIELMRMFEHELDRRGRKWPLYEALIEVFWQEYQRRKCGRPKLYEHTNIDRETHTVYTDPACEFYFSSGSEGGSCQGPGKKVRSNET